MKTLFYKPLFLSIFVKNVKMILLEVLQLAAAVISACNKKNPLQLTAQFKTSVGTN